MSANGMSAPTPVGLLGVGGSTRAGSRNLGALRAARTLSEARGARMVLADPRTLQLPLLDPDRPLDSYPEDVTWLLDAVRRADGFVLCSPTYHGSMAGAFKNALDFLVYGDDAYFDHKPVGLLALGGANGAPVLEMMTTMAHALNGLVVPTRVLVPHGAVDHAGTITDHEVAARIDRMVSEVVDLAGALRHPAPDAAVAPSAPVLTRGGGR